MSPEQAVRAGLTFSAAAGALGILAGTAQAGACDPCPQYDCSYPGLPNWTCDVKCEVKSFGGEWTTVCEGQDCVVIGGSMGGCQ